MQRFRELRFMGAVGGPMGPKLADVKCLRMKGGIWAAHKCDVSSPVQVVD